MDKKAYSEHIWKLADSLRGITYGKNIPFSIIRLFFLKYVVDNNLCAESKDDFLYNSMVYKMFAARDISGGPNALKPVLSRVDDAYNLHGIISDTINDYARDLFGYDEGWTRKHVSENHLQAVMGEIASINLEGDENEWATSAVGKEIVQYLLSVVDQYSKNYVKKVADFSTQSILAKLAGVILDVKQEEVFVDFTSGVGKSTIQIVGENRVQIYNIEISRETASIAAMLYIMNGYNFQIITDDGLQYTQEDIVGKADKVFADYPLAMKFPMPDGRKIDSSDLAICRAIECLKETGTAVIPVPSGFLFKTSRSEVERKKSLLEQGCIQSVISLPPCWSGTSMPTNLLVLTNGGNKDVLFIDATSNNVVPYGEKKGNFVITDEGIQLIKKQLLDRTSIIGATKLVPVEALMDEKCNLTPSKYIDQPVEETDDMSIEEIDEELKSLYTLFENKS